MLTILGPIVNTIYGNVFDHEWNGYENLHFDNEWIIHMSTKSHEALAMDVITTRSHLAPIADSESYEKVDAEKIIWITHVNLIYWYLFGRASIIWW